MGTAMSSREEPEGEDDYRRQQVQGAVDSAMQHNAEVKHLMWAMEQRGCPIVDTSSFFIVKRCDRDVMGGFRPFPPEAGIVLCHNHLQTKSEVENTMVHELIHAFDHCRAKIDWGNCRHHACSEVRAANLSGDCSWWRELARGHLNFRGQHQKCVKRRAQLSIAMNPACRTRDEQVDALESCYPSCFADTAPFGKIP